MRYSPAMATPDTAIHHTLAEVLLAGRLAPGTQLVETRLATIFGVSRERVRKVLHRLGHERLLELIPNRGAFVASPTLAQAREIYEARRILEGGLVGRLAGRLSKTQIEALRAHGRREQAALKRGDRAASIRLSGEFHGLLAECAGSAYVTTQLRELVSRTSMLVAFFEPAAASSCACEEHEEILSALIAGDAARALKAMQVHLSLIETRLKPRAGAAQDTDPEHVLAQAWRNAQGQARRRPRADHSPTRNGVHTE